VPILAESPPRRPAARVDPPRKGEGRRGRNPRIFAGIVAIGAIAILIGGAFVGLLIEGAADFPAALSAFDGYLGRVILFTLLQAVLSTALSMLPAIFVARALSRHPSFPGRGLLLALFAVPLGLPAIVAAMGVLALLGRAGYFAGFLSWLSGEPWPGIYGLTGGACLFQPAARCAAVVASAGHDPARSVAAGRAARHGRPRRLPLRRVAGAACGPAGRCRSRLHALHHLIHHRADARRRQRPL
jgi:hypothetical protein